MLGRGIDFEQKFKTSRWAEDLLLKGLNKIDNLIAVRLGISEVKQSDGVAYDKYGPKEPDILVLKKNNLSSDELNLINNKDLSEFPRTQFDPDANLGFVIKKTLS